MEYIGTAFREFASIFVPRNLILNCFLFCGMIQNGIPRGCFYFCSTEWNLELFSLPWKGSARNSESLLLFLLHGTEFREFQFCGTDGIPSEITNCAVNSVFHGITFFRKFPTLRPYCFSHLFCCWRLC
jgi:hypothetical protein